VAERHNRNRLPEGQGLKRDTEGLFCDNAVSRFGGDDGTETLLECGQIDLVADPEHLPQLDLVILNE